MGCLVVPWQPLSAPACHNGSRLVTLGHARVLCTATLRRNPPCPKNKMHQCSWGAATDLSQGPSNISRYQFHGKSNLALLRKELTTLSFTNLLSLKQVSFPGKQSNPESNDHITNLHTLSHIHISINVCTSIYSYTHTVIISLFLYISIYAVYTLYTCRENKDFTCPTIPPLTFLGQLWP